jgi:hypothetical protein
LHCALLITALGNPTAGDNLHGMMAHWLKAGGLSTTNENARADIRDGSEHGTPQ